MMAVCHRHRDVFSQVRLRNLGKVLSTRNERVRAVKHEAAQASVEQQRPRLLGWSS